MVDKKSISRVITLLFFVAVVMTLLIAENNKLVTMLAVYISMTVISILAYRTRNNKFRNELFGIRTDNLLKSVIWAIAFVVLFYGVAKATGLTIGLPSVPASIGSTITTIIVLGFAPILESIFFSSVLYALLVSNGISRTLSLFLHSIIFAGAHVAAYITNFYEYPSFVLGLSAIQQNIGSFFAAFLFATIGLYIMRLKTINNLAFLIIFHLGLNFVITILLSVIFIS